MTLVWSDIVKRIRTENFPHSHLVHEYAYPKMQVELAEDAIIAIKLLEATGAVTTGPNTIANQLATAETVLGAALDKDGVESAGALVKRFVKAVDRVVEPLRTSSYSR